MPLRDQMRALSASMSSISEPSVERTPMMTPPVKIEACSPDGSCSLLSWNVDPLRGATVYCRIGASAPGGGLRRRGPVGAPGKAGEAERGGGGGLLLGGAGGRPALPGG